MFSLRGGAVLEPSDWTKSFHGRIGGNRSCGLVRVQRDVGTGSAASTQPKRRLHVRNTTVRLSEGAQMHWSDRGPRARVLDPRPIRLHLRSERQQGRHLSLRLDSNRDAVEMKLCVEAFRPGASHGRDRALFFNHTLAALAMQHPVCEGSRGQHGIDTWA